MSSDTEYVRELERERREKDEFFRTAPYSPIPIEERESFAGLRYFPPDPALRVVATLEPLAERDRVTMATSDGRQRPFERYGLLRFTLDGQPQQLTAYRSADDHDHALFIPFRDALAGSETYGAGRYLDVEASHGAAGAGGQVMLDFNLAYNPYCAYNEEYSCPIPPRENTLPVAIRSGERIYHDEV